MSAVEELLALVPPPQSVTTFADRTWQQVEALLKLQLPEDYKRICDAYGLGQFGRYIEIIDLRRDADLWSSLLWAEVTARGQRDYPEFHLPFPVFPAPHGILALGRTEVNSSVFWRRDANGESIILGDAGGTNFHIEYQMSLSSFLLAWFKGEVKPSHWPKTREESEIDESILLEYEDEEDYLDPVKDRKFYPERVVMPTESEMVKFREMLQHTLAAVMGDAQSAD